MMVGTEGTIHPNRFFLSEVVFMFELTLVCPPPTTYMVHCQPRNPYVLIKSPQWTKQIRREMIVVLFYLVRKFSFFLTSIDTSHRHLII